MGEIDSNISIGVKKNNISNENSELIALYNVFCNDLKLLPKNLLANLNVAYLNLERSVSAIPKDVFLKFVKEFENISSELPDVYLNPNDYGNSNYSFIFEKLRIYYEFVSSIPPQMIANLLNSYREYFNLYSMLPKEGFEKVLYSYKRYKICLDVNSNDKETLSKINSYSSIFLDRALLYKQNESITLHSDIKMGSSFNDKNYGLSHDVNDDNGHNVVIPNFTKDDFLKLVTDLGSLEEASRECKNKVHIVFQSIYNVNLCLNNDIVLLSNMKSNMESSYLFVNLDETKKKNILTFISDQISKRYDFVKKIETDLKFGWDRLDGSVGTKLDSDDIDEFSKFEMISSSASQYANYCIDIKSLNEIVQVIAEYGYNVR